jgi:hypothetical protein
MTAERRVDDIVEQLRYGTPLRGQPMGAREDEPAKESRQRVRPAPLRGVSFRGGGRGSHQHCRPVFPALRAVDCSAASAPRVRRDGGGEFAIGYDIVELVEPELR